MTSPSSSGPSGPLFEAQVGASYLLSMLLDLDARGLPNCKIESIQFQRGAEGHPLDDVIIEGRDSNGNTAFFDIQVKRSITFAPSDEVFQDVVVQIKRTLNQDEFWSSNRQLAVAIARTTQKIETAYQDVLSWARQLDDAQTFHERISRAGMASDSMRSFVSVFRENLAASGGPHDDVSIWRLLRRFQILVFDFTATGSASNELMRDRALRALEEGTIADAQNLWARLTELSLEIAAHGGQRTRQMLLADLSTFRLAGSRNNRRALERIAEESRLALSDISNSVAGVTLLRQPRLDAVREAMTRGRFIEIRGEAGVGKSGILRNIADDVSTQAKVLVLSPNRVANRGWGAMRTAIDYDGSGLDLMKDLCLTGSGIIFIDNLDFFSAEEQTTVKDIVRFASQVPNMYVIATARLEFGQMESTWIPKDALTRLGQTEPILIGELDDTEVTALRESARRLRQVLADSHPASAIVRNLFRLSRLVVRPEDQVWPVTEAQMAKQWWDLGDGKADQGLRDRRRLLRRLTEHSLSSTEPYNADIESSRAITELVGSGTLREYGNGRITFRHDVLREWAVANFIFDSGTFSAPLALNERTSPDLARGAELAARITLDQEDGPQRWQTLFQSLTGAHETWRRAVLLALVRSEISPSVLLELSTVLLDNKAALFKDLARYVLAVEFEEGVQRLQQKGIALNGISAGWRVPRNASCGHLVLWLLSVADTLPVVALPEAIKIYTSYVSGTLGSDASTPLILPHLYRWLLEIETVRETHRYSFANRIFDGVLNGEQLKVVEQEARITLLVFCYRSPELAVNYLESFKNRQHADETRIEILKFRGSLAQVAPRQLADFTIETLVRQGEPKRCRRRHLPEGPFEYFDTRFLPASPSQGPFLELLVRSREDGLRLIRRIVGYAVQFHTGEHQDAHPIVVHFDDKGTLFPWADFYQWSRNYGNAPSLVCSALMALEAWAHRLIEAGEPVETVLADITADPAMSSAVLLVAVDIVLSHWPATKDAAIPLVACPELLCIEIGRPGRENIEFPDFFGLKALQKEPAGLATLASLQKRDSRKVSLYDLLKEFTFGPSDTNDKVRELLSRAAQRLGPPNELADLGDPRMMVLHALNLLDPQNWKELKSTATGGDEQTILQYQAPEAEAKQLQPIRDRAMPRLEENALEFAILNQLYSEPHATSDFLIQAIGWAERHLGTFDNRPEFDSDGRYRAVVEAIVSAACLLARDGTPEQLAKYGAWARTIFVRAYEGPSDPVFLMRSGLRFNPKAIAFVGQTLFLQRDPQKDDATRLLEFATTPDYAAAHGFRQVLPILQQLDTRLIPALLRCAFTAAVRPSEHWGNSDEENEKNTNVYKKRVLDRVVGEASWLLASLAEPTWPAFPLKKARPRKRRKPHSQTAENVPADLNRQTSRVEYHGPALWLKQALDVLRPENAPWLRTVFDVYREWTREANGLGEEKEAQFDNRADTWNDTYFDLAARCLGGMSDVEIEKVLADLFTGLPDESFLDCVAPFLRNADVVYFDRHQISVTQLVLIRRFVIKQLSETRLFGWNKDRDESSIAMHLAPVLATICFNDYNGITGSKCYLPAGLIPMADEVLPLLQEFVAQFRSPFFAFQCLNFMEVAPRAQELLFVLGCTEYWLERFPDNNQFWIEWRVGIRIASVLIGIFKVSPQAFEPTNTRSRVDTILGRLVELGVAQAHELEKLLYSPEP